MVIPKINSAHGSDTRNIINRVIDLINVQGKSIQDLVAKGQLTPQQYSQLLKEVNGLISKGEVLPDDLSPELLNLIQGSEGATFELLSIPRDESVTPEKTTFIEVSSNKFDKNSGTDGFLIDYPSGDAIPNQLYGYSERIPVDSDSDITVTQVNRVIYYQHSQIISSVLTPVGSVNTLRTPKNTTHIVINYEVSRKNEVQVNLGSTLFPYESYYNTLSEKIDLNDNVDLSKMIKENSITPSAASFIEESSNKFNKNKATDGFSINTNTGEFVENRLFGYSDFIKVSGGEDITVKYVNRIIYYSGNDILKSDLLNVNEVHTVITPSNTTSARVVYEIKNKDSVQINISDALLPFEEYYIELTDNKDSRYSEKKYPKNIHDIYKAPKQISMTESSSDLKTFTPLDFYGIYDDLVNAYPEYVSKKLIKTDLDGNPIYRYDFKPESTPTIENDMPKIMIVTGVHGGERASMWAAANMFREICENWHTDKILEALRFNVHFVIIPLANPFSFIERQQGLSAGRHNKNGVDIPRNLPIVWLRMEGTGSAVPGSTMYRGESPLSEIESQAVYEVYKEGGWSFVTDFHNFSSNPNENYFIWIAAEDEFVIKMGQQFIRKLSNNWKTEREYFPTDSSIVFGYVNDVKMGLNAEAKSDGYPSALTEICEILMLEPDAPEFSEDVMTYGLEVLTNWMYVAYMNATH